MIAKISAGLYRCACLATSAFLILLAVGCSRNTIRPVSSATPAFTGCIRPIELRQLGIGAADMSSSGQMVIIYYLSAPGGMGDLIVVDLATAQPISQRVGVDDLKSSTARVYDLRWSDTSTELLYLDGKSVNAVNLDTGQITVVTSCESCVTVATSPKGITATLRVTDDFAGIIVERSAGDSILITDTNLTGGNISVSPNGRWLTYLVVNGDDDSRQGMYRTRIYDLWKQTTYTTTAANYFRPSWLDDNVLVAPDRFAPKLWAFDLISGEGKEIADLSAQKLPLARITGVLMRPGNRYWLLQTYYETEAASDLWIVDIDCLQQQ